MRVLFATGDRDLAACCRGILCACGHPAETAYDGVQALERLKEFAPEALFMDERLPRLPRTGTVYGACREAGVPMVLLNLRNLNGRGDGREADYYLAFPFAPEELTGLCALVRADGGTDGKVWTKSD